MIESAKMPRRSRTARRTAVSTTPLVAQVLLDEVRDDSVSVSVTNMWSPARSRSLS
jgi:hypothetical protein